MKKTIMFLSLVIALITICSFNANAQIGGLLKKAREKTIDKITAKAEQKANALVDSVSARKQRKDSIAALVKQGPVYDSLTLSYRCPDGFKPDSANKKCVPVQPKDKKKED